MRKLMRILILLFLIICMILPMFGCSKKEDGLIGTWTYAPGQALSGVLDAELQFNTDGTGYEKLGETVLNFTYKTKDDKLMITFAGENDAYEVGYRLEDGSLVWVDTFGEESVFNKK